MLMENPTEGTTMCIVETTAYPNRQRNQLYTLERKKIYTLERKTDTM